MKKQRKIIEIGLFCIMLALPLRVYAQVRPPVQVTVTNANDDAVYTFMSNTPDSDMKKVPAAITAQRQKNVLEYIRLLAEYINEKSNNDFERVKKAHDWVALNIRYDTQSFFSGRYSSQEFDAVIKRGSGVCAGYADAFKYLCDALEIECSVVSGYARGYGSGLFWNENVMYSNHAWNIVTIEGKKYLIDSTWDAGYLSGRNFQAKYTTDYLFTDPEVFIYDHYSYNSDTQLLDPLVSADDFNNLPFLKPQFFQAFEAWPDLARVTEVISGENSTLEFSLKEGYEISYGWYTSKGESMGSHSYPSRRIAYSINIPKFKPGKYFLRVYVRHTGERTYWSCGEFGFEVKNQENV
jgi:hypothetical protein